MNLIAEIKDRLKKYTAVSIEENSNSISVTPNGGFTVWAIDQGKSYTIGFEGWHEDFETVEAALNCFGWGLSNQCRLKIFSRGGRPHKWVVQNLENGEWVEGSTTGLLFFQFWRKQSISYKQNMLTIS